MPKPVPFMQRRVGFHRTPMQVPVPVKHVPILVWYNAIFIAHPTNVSIFEKRSVCENQRVWLSHPKVFDHAGEIVNMPFAARAIEPEFGQLAVVACELLQ